MSNVIQNIQSGFIFFGTHLPECSIKILQVYPENNCLSVEITHPHKIKWIEDDWNLQHTIWGFESGEYYTKDSKSVERLINNLTAAV